jgi:hypothetical protein
VAEDHTDSAGQPFTGRSVPDPGFAGDDGAADRRLDEVLAEFAAGDATAYDVQRVLVDVRIVVPVVAEVGESEVDDAGLVHDKSADMATVVLVGEDGRRGLLAFAGTERLAAWRPDARPVPVRASQAAAAALEEDADALLLDLGGPVPFVLEGALMRALAQGRPWVRPAQDPEVEAAVREAFAPEQGLLGLEIVEGESTDITVLIRLRTDVPAEALEGLGERVGGRLAESDVLRDRVTGGLDVRVVPAGDDA